MSLATILPFPRREPITPSQLYLCQPESYYLALAATDILYLIGHMAAIAPDNPITPEFILTQCRFWARMAHCELIYAASFQLKTPRLPTAEECALLTLNMEVSHEPA